MIRKYTQLVVSSVVAIGFAAPVSAQEAGRSPAAEASDVGSSDIIVTARRREEALQDVPISVSVLSGDQLAQSGVQNAMDLQYRTPSLAITSGQTQRSTVSFAIRGQRVQETQLFSDPPVGTYFAEVVNPRNFGFANTFYDIGSVQVLKGVQGTLFGRNMTGGAVLVEPNHPELGRLTGSVTGQYGNYNMWDLAGVVNVPIGENVALRFAGKTHERDGWARDIGSGLRLDNQNYDSFRVSALVQPSSAIENLTIFDWYKSDENGTASFMTAIHRPSVIDVYEGYRAQGLTDTNIPAQFEEAQRLFREREFTLRSGSGDGSNLDYWGKPSEKIKNWGITNKTTIDLSDDIRIKNIFGYRKQSVRRIQDYDGIPAILTSPMQYKHLKNISEELQLQGTVLNGRLDFIAGAFYFEEKGKDGALSNTLPERVLVSAGQDPRTTPIDAYMTDRAGTGYSRSKAAFIAGTAHLTDELSLSGGLRYTIDKVKTTLAPTSPFMPNSAGGLGVCNFDIDSSTPGKQTVPFEDCHFTKSKTFKEWTYDATLQYEPSPAVTMYAAFRHGYRAGGFGTRAQDYPTFVSFAPEFVDEYEVGLKTSHPLGTGRLTTSTALFRQDGTNVQKQRQVFVDGNIYSIVDNTAAQRNQGGEFEATLAVRNFTLSAFYSYVDVKITKGALTSAFGPEIAQRGTPKHQVGVTGVMSPPIDPAIGKLDVALTWSWRSKVYMHEFERVGSTEPAYSLVNARASLDDIGGSGFHAAAFVNNLLDERYRIGTLSLLSSLGFTASAYGEPRMYGIEVGYRF